MTINTHDVTVADVTSILPGDFSFLSETSQGLNTVMIEGWIKTGAGLLNSLIRSQGKDIDNLGPDEREVIRMGIIAFAESRCLKATGREQAAIDAAERSWRDTQKAIRDFPSEMAPSDDASVRIRGREIDPAYTTQPKWRSDRFGGW